MSGRKERFYNHRVDVYRPNDMVRQKSGDVVPRTYSLLYTDVPCRRETKTVFTDTVFVGQTVKEPSAGMVDILHLDITWIIGPEYVVKFTNPGPDQNEFFICRGQPAIKDLFAKKQSVLISRTLKPDIV